MIIPKKTFIPFDPTTRRTEAMLEKNGHELSVTKGAVAVIAPMSGIYGKELAELETKMENFASKGYRIIAVAVSHKKRRCNLPV